ncbi:MAG: hypothetical protein KIT58_19905, partial [Planctomycetota bacterium]|nr:hypothetical protein [Planctomycetota bacterium]
SDVEVGLPPTAEVHVTIGPFSWAARVGPGAVLPVGQGLLEVAGVDHEVHLRWARLLPRDPARWEVLVAPRAREGALVVREMSLARLPDGAWLSVGNVVEVEGRRAVTVHVYPPTYADDVEQGYDRHVGAGLHDLLEGRAGRLVLEALEPGDPTAQRFGHVRLRRL